MEKGDKVLRGREKLNLIRDLADGKWTQEQLATRYERSQPAISSFAKRNAEDIAALRDNVEAELQSFWIARKKDRIAQYQGYNEQLTDLAELVDDEKVPAVLKTAMTALRSVAEELGHLTPKDTGEATKIDVRIVGVDGDAL